MNDSGPSASAVILFAHGSRDPLWRLPIEAVATQIRNQQPDAAVLCAYLELCTPSLSEAAAQLIGEGAKQVKVFPLFFGVGKHAREDLPLLMEELRAAHPNIQVDLLPTAGEYPQVTALMADIALAS
jgi:sirohydrochlorin cobaltochelatase